MYRTGKMEINKMEYKRINSLWIALFSLSIVSCKSPTDVNMDSTRKTAAKKNETAVKHYDMDKSLGLDSLAPEKGNEEVRLNINKFPWLGGEMIVLKFSKTDTTGTVYRYTAPDAENHYATKKIPIKPKRSWSAIADSLLKYNLFSIPDQTASDTTKILDGENYTLQFSNGERVMNINYQNPKMYQDSQAQKFVAFLNFINTSVVPIYHTVITKDKILDKYSTGNN